MASPPIPNRPNPKPRNSEAVDPLRRSFGGNPFPVNIPSSDVCRRKSFGGRDFSDKENETKAPPPTTPKGSKKNFMSPTISAVSKINPSPRKRSVLSDKNQGVSRSLSDVKGLTFEEEDTKIHQSCSVSFSDVIHIIGTTDEKKKRFERPDDMTVTDLDESEALDDKGIVYSDPRFRISPRPCVPYTSPEFADREVVVAGPLLPPYDPKKNYLSPRPQFLHYRPNPRVEKNHLDDECKQLEELFISESSSSDTEQLSAAEEEQDKDVSHEAVAGEEIEEDMEQVEAESDEEVVCESIEETSRVPKQSRFRPFRFLGWFLALSLGYLLVSASFSGLSILEESPLYEFHLPNGVREFAEGNKLSEKLWTLTESSLVYMDKLISRLGGRTEEYAPLQFHNLTYSLEESSTVFQPTRVEINEEPLHEKVRGENSLEEEIGGEENSDIEDGEVDEQTEMTPGTDIDSKEGEENLLEAFAIEEPEVILPEVNNDAEEGQEMLGNGSTNEKLEAESEDLYIKQHDDVDTAAIKETVLADAECESEDGLASESSDDLLPNAESEPEEGFSGIAAETSDDLHPKLQQSEVVDAETESEETAAETSGDDLQPQVRRSFNKAMTVLSSTVLVLLAAVAFLFARKAKHVAAVSASEPAAPETEELNLAHVPVVENLVEEEVDDRISNSVHKKSTSLSNNKGPKEHQSLVGGSSKLRRESMASSASEYSVGSFSYGSFTTYEKIPIKSGGDGEEEMITPVRRSSRLRKHLEPSSML